MIRFAAPTLVLTLATGGAFGQVQWTPHVDLAPRSGHAMAYDAARERTMMFGGGYSRDDLWEWDGNTWTLRRGAITPPGRSGHAMTFDPIRRRLVVFGGASFLSTATYLDDTWEWDGAEWTQRTPARRPAARTGARMVYDPVRERVLLFGGLTVANYQAEFFDDLWEWDGRDWIPVNVPPGPAGRSDHIMVFDAARSRTVVAGGWSGGSGRRTDTWEWDGTTWTERRPATIPPLNRGAAGWFDHASARVMAFGEVASRFVFPSMQLWAFDGADWSHVLTAPSGVHQQFVSLAHDSDRGRTVLFGGASGISVFGATWEFDGAQWSMVSPGESPAFRFQTDPSVAFDSSRGVTVMVGNSIGSHVVETWEHDGSRWTRRASAGGPSISIGQAVAYDAARAKLVLFGGQSPYGNDQTWEYDGTAWTRLSPSVRPPWLYGHSMAFDPVRQRVVLFGATSTNAPGVTWEWDGTTWTEQSPTTVPWARRFAGMAWHPQRRRVVMYGGGEGRTTSSLFPDLWEWDGNDWTLITGAAPPGERAKHRMVWDSVRQRMVVHGGRDTRDQLTDTWEWYGDTWSRRTPQANPGQTINFGMAFDEVRGETLLFGGIRYATWTYGAETVAATTAFGAGCAGTAGVPDLAAAAGSRPWLGDDYRLVLRSVPANAPCSFEIGFSTRRWLGLQLPYDLTQIGLTGCTQYVSTDVMIGRTTRPDGTAELTVPIPVIPGLLDRHFYSQVFTLDAGANPLGGTLTNAIDARIGGR